MPRAYLLAAAIAAVLPLNLGSAVAAPQILGIVASNGAVPLACGADGCHADLSTFCLQQPRANPPLGQRYDLADAEKVMIVGTRSTGETVRLPAAPFMTFATARGFTSVEVTMTAATMTQLGLATVAIEVAPAASLVPAAADNDPDPQSADEIALALGTYRQLGSKYFDESSEAADAIRLTNRMINDLPKHKRQTTDADGHLINAALRSDAARVADPAGITLARSYHDTCRIKVDVTHHIDSMRACLQGTHDRLVTSTNIDFWHSLSSY
jgi:hypothetical protein